MALTMFALFVVMPLVEIYLIVQLGQSVGVWWTIAILLADAALGTYLVRREGAKAFVALQRAVAEHRVPSRELADGALILVGGALLVTPGFLSDVFAVVCLLPLTRPAARATLSRAIARRWNLSTFPAPTSARDTSARDASARNTRPRGPAHVVRGEVVEPEGDDTSG